MTEILLLEDEVDLAEILIDNLKAEGYSVFWTISGEEALKRWQKKKPDLAIIDIMLPGIDGFEVCEKIREKDSQTPILFISARGFIEDRLRGLSLGGDDYLVKPFHLSELLLRVRNMLRRSGKLSQPSPTDLFELDGNSVDLLSGRVSLRDGTTSQLSERELRLLKLFIEREGEIIEREQIIDWVWPELIFPSSREIERLVNKLRKIFEREPEKPQYFQSVGGVRFKFTRGQK